MGSELVGEFVVDGVEGQGGGSGDGVGREASGAVGDGAGVCRRREWLGATIGVSLVIHWTCQSWAVVTLTRLDWRLDGQKKGVR